MTVIYQTTITHIGACATMALEEQMLITFREGAPADIEEYCFIHNHGELAGTLQPGAELQLGEQRYPVTAVGEVAEQNLREPLSAPPSRAVGWSPSGARKRRRQ